MVQASNTSLQTQRDRKGDPTVLLIISLREEALKRPCKVQGSAHPCACLPRHSMPHHFSGRGS